MDINNKKNLRIDDEIPQEVREKASALYRQSLHCSNTVELGFYTDELSKLKCAPFIYFFAKNKKDLLTDGQIETLYRSIVFTSNMEYITKFVNEIGYNYDIHSEL